MLNKPCLEMEGQLLASGHMVKPRVTDAELLATDPHVIHQLRRSMTLRKSNLVEISDTGAAATRSTFSINLIASGRSCS